MEAWKNFTLKKYLFGFFTALFTAPECYCLRRWMTNTSNISKRLIFFKGIQTGIILYFQRKTWSDVYDMIYNCLSKVADIHLFFFQVENFSKCLSHWKEKQSFIYLISDMVTRILLFKLLLNQSVNTWILIKTGIGRISPPIPLIHYI